MQKTHNRKWYNIFFDEWYLKYWVRPITQERTEREVDAIIRYLGLTCNSRILDLCCGQGRHSLELARRGYNVTGFDLSETLLAASQEQADKEGLKVNFVRGDMREIPFEDEFDGIFNFYTAFGYFEKDEDNEMVLRAASKALKPKGKFLLDYPCLEGRMSGWQKQEFFEYNDGTVMLHEMTHNVFEQTIDNHVLYITKDNQRHRTGFTLRHYYGRELTACLERSGMEVLQTFGDTEGTPLNNRHIRVLVLAQKS